MSYLAADWLGNWSRIHGLVVGVSGVSLSMSDDREYRSIETFPPSLHQTQIVSSCWCDKACSCWCDKHLDMVLDMI